MSDAPAAPVTENGVPPAAQENVNETPEFKVFAGNLAYSTTDEGLKAFFAPVQSDILSAQVIMRGHHSAGYGFVALSSAEAAQKAVELLNKVELDGRQVIIENAKPSDQKNKEKERRPKRRPGRRGGKPSPVRSLRPRPMAKCQRQMILLRPQKVVPANLDGEGESLFVGPGLPKPRKR